MICTAHWVLFGWSDRGGCDGRGNVARMGESRSAQRGFGGET
jgi:hypothetical protein